MEKKEFSGKSLEEALSEAAKSFGVDIQDIAHTVVTNSSGGFLSKIFSRSVKIEAWVRNHNDLQKAAREAVLQAMNLNSGEKKNKEEKKERANKPERMIKLEKKVPGERKEKVIKTEKPARPEKIEKEPRTERKVAPRIRSEEHKGVPKSLINIDNPQIQEELHKLLKLFLAAFEVTDPNFTINKDENNNILIQINDEKIEAILSKSDKLSNSFEHVFKRIMQKKLGDFSERIFLNAGDSSKLRHNYLSEMAVAKAELVKKTGKSIPLHNRTSQERRIIHLALDGYPGIATRSVGTGDRRSLLIYSTDKQHHVNKPHHKKKKKVDLTTKLAGSAPIVNQLNAEGVPEKHFPKRKSTKVIAKPVEENDEK